jgi:hypothetical protein
MALCAAAEPNVGNYLPQVLPTRHSHLLPGVGVLVTTPDQRRYPQTGIPDNCVACALGGQPNETLLKRCLWYASVQLSKDRGKVCLVVER